MALSRWCFDFRRSEGGISYLWQPQQNGIESKVML
jgi:hypothetical protein